MTIIPYCKNCKHLGFDGMFERLFCDVNGNNKNHDCPKYEEYVVERMVEKEVCDVCANISLKRMYMILLKVQEMILDSNLQYNKKEILNYLTSIEHDILMLNDKDNRVDRDLFE